MLAINHHLTDGCTQEVKTKASICIGAFAYILTNS